MKNNQLTSVRSPEFSTPPSIRRCITSNKPCTLSTCESQSNSQSYEAKRKRQERDGESENQRPARLDRDQQRKRNAKESESENQRTGCLSEQQERSKNNRSNRNTQGKRSFQVQTRQSSAMTKSADREQRRTKRAHSMNEQLISETKRRTLLNEYVWPAAIPTQLKERCLPDISNDMSMPVLRQSTCT